MEGGLMKMTSSVIHRNNEVVYKKNARWHGTAGGYTNHRCRCRDCTEAWRVAHRSYMDRNPIQRQKNNIRTGINYYMKRRNWDRVEELVDKLNDLDRAELLIKRATR
jgi:hypothetical protein